MSGLTLLSKTACIETCPRELDEELKYKRPSRPVSDCSMTWVTLLSRVSAEAPG
jgi:hypothetical protein